MEDDEFLKSLKQSSAEDGEVDKMVEEMKVRTRFNTPVKPPEAEKIDRETVTDYVLSKYSQLVALNIDLAAKMQRDLTSGYTPEEVDVYTNLMRTTADLVDKINKIPMQDSKHETALKIKQMEVEANTKMNNNSNKTLLIATRAQMLEKMKDTALIQTVDEIVNDGINEVTDSPVKEDHLPSTSPSIEI